MKTKKILALSSAALLGVALTSCNGTAKDLVSQIIVDNDSKKISGDFELPSYVKSGNDTYPITWESDNKDILNFVYTEDDKSTEEDESLENVLATVDQPKDGMKEVTFRATVKAGMGKATSEDFRIRVTKYEDPLTHAMWTEVKKGDIVKVKGKCVAAYGSYAYLADSDGFYLMYGGKFKVGTTYEVSGEIDIYNNLIELKPTSVKTRGVTNIENAKGMVELTADNVADYATVTPAIQGSWVKISGEAVSSTSIKIGDKVIALYGQVDAAKKINLTYGAKYTCEGFASIYGTTHQYNVFQIPEKTEDPTDEKIAEGKAVAVKFDKKYSSSKEIKLPEDVTAEIVSGATATVKDGKILIAPQLEEDKVTVTLTGTHNGKSASITVQFTTKLPELPAGTRAELKFHTDTVNLDATDDDKTLQALGFGDKFVTHYVKAEGSNATSNVTRDTFKFYKSDILEISLKDTNKKIVAIYAVSSAASGAQYSLSNLTVTANDKKVENKDGIYTINANKVVLTNNAQVRFNTLIIVYEE